jgi:guanine deaminase
MCFGAICWARPARVFFAASHEDAAAAGFDDSLIYQELALPPSDRGIPMIRLIDERATLPFLEWRGKADRTPY